jgi:glucan biosynthesis protein
MMAAALCPQFKFEEATMTAKQLAKQVWLEWLKHSHMLPEQFTLVGYDPTNQTVAATYHAVSGRDTEMQFAVQFMLQAIAIVELFEVAETYDKTYAHDDSACPCMCGHIATCGNCGYFGNDDEPRGAQ